MVAPRLVVLGSITLDAIFRMARFPAPGETLFAESAAVLPGGKGLNQAVAVARLGAEASLIGRTGDDAFADVMLELARREGIDTSNVTRAAGQTGIAVPIVVASGENAILAAPGANLELTIAEIEAAAPAIRAADALLVQFETPLPAVARAIEIASGAGTLVVLNPAPVQPFDLELLRLVDVVVVNEVEAAMLAPGVDSHDETARHIQELGPRSVVVTLGPAGGAWASGQGSGRFRAHEVEAVDTVGAGDCFCGALAVALCHGMDLPRAAEFAAAAAAISVTRAGAAPSMPRRSELEELFPR